MRTNWITKILNRLGRRSSRGLSNMCCHLSRVSKVVERILIVDTPTTLALESIMVLGIPSGAVVKHASLSLITRKIDNMNQVEVNGLDGATVSGISQVIQIRPVGGS